MRCWLLCLPLLACGAERVTTEPTEPTASSTVRSQQAQASPSDSASAPEPNATAEAATAESSASAQAALPPAPVPVLTSEMVREVVRAHFTDIGACYQAGVAREPNMKGDITLSLAIDGTGEVVSADAPTKPPKQPKIPAWKRRAMKKKAKKQPPVIYDEQVVGCVVEEFKKLRFPASKRGMVTFEYPLQFATK